MAVPSYVIAPNDYCAKLSACAARSCPPDWISCSSRGPQIRSHWSDCACRSRRSPGPSIAGCRPEPHHETLNRTLPTAEQALDWDGPHLPDRAFSGTGWPLSFPPVVQPILHRSGAQVRRGARGGEGVVAIGSLPPVSSGWI